MVKAVRGAIQMKENSAQAISSGVVKLLSTLMKENKLEEEQLVSVIFSQTSDLTALNPAGAGRQVGFSSTPLFCTQEPEYPNALPLMVRVLLTFNCEDKNQEIVPVYLDGAEKVRPDLFKKNS